MTAMLTIATATAEGLIVCRPAASATSFGTNSPGSFAGQREPAEIVELAGEDDDGDARR